MDQQRFAKIIYRKLLCIAVASIIARIGFEYFRAIEPAFFINYYVPAEYREGVKALLGMPIYLHQYFKQSKINYQEFGNFGLIWKANMTTSRCNPTKLSSEKIQKATSGNVFLGDKIRYFDRKKVKFKRVATSPYRHIYDSHRNGQERFNCKKWGVVTTIFEPPSEAVRRFLYRKNWCVVVVADQGMATKVHAYCKGKKNYAIRHLEMGGCNCNFNTDLIVITCLNLLPSTIFLI